MSLAAVRQAIIDTMTTVAGIGLVHGYERYTNSQKDFRALYEANGQVLGWFVRRVTTRELIDTSHRNREVVGWRIQGYMSLDDATGSEILFDTIIEALRAAFRIDETLGDVVDTTMVDDKVGLQLDDSGPVMFAGILCHGVRLSLQTIGGVDIGTTPADVFATFHADWDIPVLGNVAAPLPAAENDAEDTVTLPQT